MKITISQLRSMVEEALLDEKKKKKAKGKAAAKRKSKKKARRKKRKAKKTTAKRDACYHKVKSRYDVWPSAYASGALVKCRKVGAKNWGNKSEEVEQDPLRDMIREAISDLKEKKSNPRVPRRKGQKAKSKKHSDLYTDEDPKGTIQGLKFATEADATKSVSKIKSSDRSHAHKVQAAVAMEQRAKAAGKASSAAVYRKYINSVKKDEVNESAADFEAKKLARHFLEVIKGEGAPLKKFKPFLFQQMKDMYTGDYPEGVIKKASDMLKDGRVMESAQEKLKKEESLEEEPIEEKKKKKTDGKGSGSKGYSLRDWFKGGGWVQTGGRHDGKPCAKQPGQKTKPYCRDPDDRAKLSKKEKDKRAAKKRKKDPNPDRKGKAKTVTQKKRKKG